MTNAQKIIKYFAIGLAVALIVSIISGTVTLLYNVGEALGVIKEEGSGLPLSEITGIESYTELSLELGATAVEIKLSDGFKAECNNERVKFNCRDGKLTVTEKTSVFGNETENKKLVLYIPENAVMDKVDIDAGAGQIIIESLTAKRIDIDLGAGNLSAQNLTVTESADIDGGVGEINITGGAINDLDLDIGMGSTKLSVDLTGDCDISAGVGALDLVLNRDKSEYTAVIDKGIGEVIYDGVTVSDGSKLGDGANKLDIDGGIGKITVSFAVNENN